MNFPNFFKKCTIFSNKYLSGIILIGMGILLLLLFSGSLIIRVLGIVAGILLINKGLQCHQQGSVFSFLQTWFNKLK